MAGVNCILPTHLVVDFPDFVQSVRRCCLLFVVCCRPQRLDEKRRNACQQDTGGGGRDALTFEAGRCQQIIWVTSYNLLGIQVCALTCVAGGPWLVICLVVVYLYTVQ